ncbi:hypothetical protein [Streptomyces sp. NPDC048191]|uniref:ATP-dependent DNA ligase n=1 Tax=Streptomyces sp. NPDC048191 TaxID=3155484 RepID=UPI00340B5B9B
MPLYGLRTRLRSRRGTQMGKAFPEVVAGTAQLPDQTALDGELIVWDWEAGRLSFEQLQNRLHRRGAAADRWPAQFVAFDLLRMSETDTTALALHAATGRDRGAVPYTRAVGAVGTVPVDHRPATVREWLTWGSVRIEGVVFKRLNDPYRPTNRGWRKYKTRETTEAIVDTIIDRHETHHQTHTD